MQKFNLNNYTSRNLSELSKKDVLFAVDTHNAYRKYLHNEAVNN